MADNYDHLSDEDLCGSFMPKMQKVYPEHTSPEVMICHNLTLRFAAAHILARVCYDEDSILHISIGRCEGELCPIITDEIKQIIHQILISTHGRDLNEDTEVVIDTLISQ